MSAPSQRPQLQRLGLGTAPLAGLYEPVNAESAAQVIEKAWELNIRYFDTAPYYGSGLAERRLGEALRGKPRDEFIVSTKVGYMLEPDALPWQGAYFDFSAEAALRSLEASLERLSLDRIDIALVHDPVAHHREAVAGAFPALIRLREEGVIRAIGAGMNQAKPLARLVREIDVDCVLIAGRWTILDRSASDELLPICEERRIAVITGGVLNSDVLAGGRHYNYDEAPPDILSRVNELRGICSRHQVPLEAAALQFPLRHPAVKYVVVGCRNAEEVVLDTHYFDLDLPDAIWADVEPESSRV